MKTLIVGSSAFSSILAIIRPSFSTATATVACLSRRKVRMLFSSARSRADMSAAASDKQPRQTIRFMVWAII
ncbi:hypothetical protein [Alistipes ihumii]|uniref:Secreted protein n=1 Tax=Alistipes ihumii AP11 TaxID=1211813 RepID=A0ABY5UZZ7_9BACT|nr:hypothetical protein [Alistipes ihumii]UWN56974.1 hypothetical protein NQ491_10015 [Alistipes ihumii AP11]